MKFNTIKIAAVAVLISVTAFNCSNEDMDSATMATEDLTTEELGRSLAGTYVQEDQMARPAINTVFATGAMEKNAFNVTIPSEQGAAFQESFEAKLLALNPGYENNILSGVLGITVDAEVFTTVLATDVLSVSLDGATSFFDPNPLTVLTGRRLSDDVITTELTLIFGGVDGTENPNLTDDFVDANDKAFSNSFPYLASPH